MADTIINKRMEGAQSAVNKMENSMQNIILQEMENLDGILIATTNLGTESSLVSGLMIVIELRSREQP